MKRFALLSFVTLALLELLCQAFHLDQLHHLVKPMLMITLGLYYFFSVEADIRSWNVILALIFSFLGDSFLLYEQKAETYFILGLLSFLLAHLFYVFAFRQHRDAEVTDRIDGLRKLRMAFPIILAATGLVVVLYPHLGPLKFPVVVYAAVLMFMVLNAVFRYKSTSPQSFWMVFAGAVLFMISDSILAVNRFLSPVSHAGLLIMATYLSAQYLIIKGLNFHPTE